MNDYSLSSTKTQEERKRLYSEISLVQDALFRQQDFKKILDTKVSPQLGNYISGFLQDRPLNAHAIEKIADRLAEIKKKLDGLKIVSLTLAIEPKKSTIDKIIFFVREHIEKDIIIEINVEPNIIGGAIIVFNGLYRDYSLKTKLDEVFRTKREQILNPKH